MMMLALLNSWNPRIIAIKCNNKIINILERFQRNKMKRSKKKTKYRFFQSYQQPKARAHHQIRIRLQIKTSH